LAIVDEFSDSESDGVASDDEDDIDEIDVVFVPFTRPTHLGNATVQLKSRTGSSEVMQILLVE